MPKKLTAEKDTELNGYLTEMISNGISENDIQVFADDFVNQFGVDETLDVKKKDVPTATVSASLGADSPLPIQSTQTGQSSSALPSKKSSIRRNFEIAKQEFDRVKNQPITDKKKAIQEIATTQLGFTPTDEQVDAQLSKNPNKFDESLASFEIKKQRDERVSNSTVEDFVTERTDKYNELKNNRVALAEYQQSKEGKIAELVSDVQDGDRISDEDFNYLKKNAPTAVNQLFSTAKQLNPELPIENINTIADLNKQKREAQNRQENYQQLTNTVSILGNFIDVSKLGTEEIVQDVDRLRKEKEKQELLADQKYDPTINRNIKSESFGQLQTNTEQDLEIQSVRQKYDKLIQSVANAQAFEYVKKNPETTPLQVGLEWMKIQDPTTYSVYQNGAGKSKEVQKNATKIGISILESSGDEKQILKGQQAKAEFENNFPDEIKNETIRRLALEKIKSQGGANTIANKPYLDLDEADVYANQLPKKYKDAYYNSIRPDAIKSATNTGYDYRGFNTSDRKPYIEIPSSGGIVNEFFTGAAQPLVGIAKTISGAFESKEERANRALSPTPIFEQKLIDRDLIKNQIKELDLKPTLTPDEINKRNDLQDQLELKSKSQVVADGMANLTGQVVAQGLLTVGGGGVVTTGLKTVGLGLRGAGYVNRAEQIAAFAGEIKNTSNVAGSTVAYLSSYDDARTQAELLMPKSSELEKMAFASGIASLNAATERIFKDEKVFDAFKKEIAPEMAVLVKNLSAGKITEDAFQSSLKKLVTTTATKFVPNVIIENQKETFEEVLTRGGETVLKTIGIATGAIDPRDVNYDDELAAIQQTYIETTISGLPASLAAGITETRRNNISQKAIYDFSNNPTKIQEFIDVVNFQQQQGTMSAGEAIDKIQSANTLQEIAQKVIPNVGTKKPLNEREKVSLTNLFYAKRKLTNDIETDPDTKTLSEAQLSEVNKKIDDILLGKVVVDNNFDIYTPEEYNAKLQAEKEVEIVTPKTENNATQNTETPSAESTTVVGQNELPQKETTVNENVTEIEVGKPISATLEGKPITIDKTETGYTYTTPKGRVLEVSETEHQENIADNSLIIPKTEAVVSSTDAIEVPTTTDTPTAETATKVQSEEDKKAQYITDQMEKEGLVLELAPLVINETPEIKKRKEEIEERNAKVKERIKEISDEYDAKQSSTSANNTSPLNTEQNAIQEQISVPTLQSEERPELELQSMESGNTKSEITPHQSETTTKEKEAVTPIQRITGNKDAVTLSGLTENERQQQITERDKSLKLSKEKEAESNLAEQVRKFNAMRRNDVKRPRLLNDIRKESLAQGFEVKYDGKGVEVFKKNKAGKPNKINSYSSEVGRRSTTDEKALHERSEAVQDLYVKLMDLDIDLDARNSDDNSRFSESQLQSAITDIENGIPSRQANEILNKVEKLSETGKLEVGDKINGYKSIPIQELISEAEAVRDEELFKDLTNDEVFELYANDILASNENDNIINQEYDRLNNEGEVSSTPEKITANSGGTNEKTSNEEGTKQETSKTEESGIAPEIPTKKQEAKAKLDEARLAFRKAAGLSSGGLEALPEFVNLVKAYANYGFESVKEAFAEFKKDFPELDIKQKDFENYYEDKNTKDEKTNEAKTEKTEVLKGDDEAGIAHRLTEETRKAIGLPEYTKETITDEELDQMADAEIKQGYNIKKLIAKMSKGTLPTALEQTIMKKYLASLEAQIEKNPTNELINDYKTAVEASDAVGSEIGRSLRSRKGGIIKDDSIAAYFLQEMESTGVDELTEAQKNKVEKEFNDIQEANRKLQEKIAQLEIDKARLIANQNVPKQTKNTEKKADLKQQKEDIKASIKQKLKEARSQFNSTPIPYLNEILAITPDVAKLTKVLVEEGIIKLDEIVDNIHEIVKDGSKNITKKDIIDIIAGKYNEKKQTRNEIAKQLIDLKTQATLIGKLQDLENGIEPKSEQKKIERNKEIASLRKKINENYLTKLASAKNNIQNQIDKLTAYLKSGEFLNKEENTELKLDKEAIALKDELIRLKKERDLRLLRQQYKNRSLKQKAVDTFLEIINVPRTIMSSMDFSAPLRQGLIASIAHPTIAAKAFAEMFKQAVSQKRFDRWFSDIRESELFGVMEKSGLYVADPHDLRLSAKEEQFMNNLAEKIPFIGGAVRVPQSVPLIGGKKVGGLIKGSERAYVSYLNKMRVDLFTQGAQVLESMGKTYDNSPKEYEGLASFVNNSTGRGKLGVIESAAPILNSVFFSPRLIASRLNLLNPLYYAQLPPYARKMAIKDMIKFVSFGVTALALIKQAWGCPDDCDDCTDCANIELDPRSTDFGKIKVGNTRYDTWGGFQQYVRIIAQMMTGEAKSSTTGNIRKIDGEGLFGKDRADVLGSFARGKLAPVPSSILDLVSGRNIIGEKVGVKDIAERNLLPLIYSDVKEAYKEQGIKSLATVGLPASFGIGVNTYKTKEQQQQEKLEELNRKND